MRVLLVQAELRPYRLGFISELARRVDLTLVQPLDAASRGDAWRVCGARLLSFRGYSAYQGLGGILASGEFDRVVFPYDVHWLGCLAHSFILPRNKVVWWGIPRGNRELANRMKVSLAKRNAVIVYSPLQRRYLIDAGVPEDRVHVANNSVGISRSLRSHSSFAERRSILFVGSLESRKRLDLIIRALHQSSVFQSNRAFKLSIVGDGPMRKMLVDLVRNLEMSDRVVFHGQVIDEVTLASFYGESVVACSFGQAGLSVLQSMGYGVPFMTSKGAISGGEIENIQHGVNGFVLTPDVEVWAQTFDAVLSTPSRLEQLGRAAMMAYDSSASVERMADSFCAALSARHAG